MNTLRIKLIPVLSLLGALVATAATAQTPPKLKVGLMLPCTGTCAALGAVIENGFRLHVAEQGGLLGGRELEFFKVDDESDPGKALVDPARGCKPKRAQRRGGPVRR